jgi:hypothetical protein
MAKNMVQFQAGLSLPAFLCCGLLSVDTSIGGSSTRRGSSNEQEAQSF